MIKHLQRKTWVIMDKKRMVIGAGVPRNRELKFLTDESGTSRILTYPSKGRAEAGFKTSGFYCFGEVGKYMAEQYGEEWQHWGHDKGEALQAVEVVMIIAEEGHTIL